jgi:hypothetical protein
MFILYTDTDSGLFIHLHHFKMKILFEKIRKKLKLNKFLVKKNSHNDKKYQQVFECI